MTEKKGSSKVVIAIVLVCVVIIGVGLAVYFASNGGVGIIKPKEVTLTGTVRAAVAVTFENITFTSLSNGETYVADINGETYSITLTNGDSYNVTVAWKLLGFPGGNWNVGTLNVDTTQSSITENWVIPNYSTPVYSTGIH
jgi:hypothetical protein